MSLTNIAILVDLILRTSGVVDRAIKAKRDVTDEEIEEVFARADRADAAWKAGLTASPNAADEEKKE